MGSPRDTNNPLSHASHLDYLTLAPTNKKKKNQIMPRFFDDYSNTYLTHDSSAGRKQQRRGWKFRENFRLHYESFVPDWRKGPMGLASAQQAFVRARGKDDPAVPPLPDGWKEDVDDVTGITYYIAPDGARTWVRPSFIPPPPGAGPPPASRMGPGGGVPFPPRGPPPPMVPPPPPSSSSSQYLPPSGGPPQPPPMVMGGPAGPPPPPPPPPPNFAMPVPPNQVLPPPLSAATAGAEPPHGYPSVPPPLVHYPPPQQQVPPPYPNAGGPPAPPRY